MVPCPKQGHAGGGRGFGAEGEQQARFRAAVPNLFGTFLGTGFVEDKFFHRGEGDGSGSSASDGERWGAADEASLARPPPTSCCATRFLTGLGPGVGDP